jgi:hypothetical protein
LYFLQTHWILLCARWESVLRGGKPTFSNVRLRIGCQMCNIALGALHLTVEHLLV